MHETVHVRAAKWPRSAAVVTSLLAGVAACGDDPFAFDWSDSPDTVLIYSLAHPEPNLVSGYGFFQDLLVRVEAPTSTGQWDIALDTRNDELVLLPPGALGITPSARIATLENTAMDDVRRAPGDTLDYEPTNPVPVRVGTTYVIKTNRAPGSFGVSCVYHAKMEAVDIDLAGGALTFRHVTNPICNSTDLVPPD